MEQSLKKITASCIISEIKQSDIYLTVKARLFESPGANLNGVRVTTAFIDEIVANAEKYVGLPLYADTTNLLSGEWQNLGHLYDAESGEFHSVQIGSFYQFERENLGEGAALVGYARIPKRNKVLSKAIGELFAEGRLKFSFEIACNAYAELEDGTLQIDADPTNYLEGMAIVTFPACESAVALEMVAAIFGMKANAGANTDDNKDGGREMNELDGKGAEEEAKLHACENAECETAESEGKEQTASDQEKDCREQQAAADNREENPEKKEPEEETAACDGEGKCEPEKHEENGAECEENAECKEDAECKEAECEKEAECKEDLNANCGKCEEEPEAEKCETAENPDEEFEDEPESKDDEEALEEDDEIAKRAEKARTTMDELVAKLEASIAELRTEIAEMREKIEKPVHLAEVTAECDLAANPFVTDMKVGSKYHLLESCEKATPKKYSLLEIA